MHWCVCLGEYNLRLGIMKELHPDMVATHQGMDPIQHPGLMSYLMLVHSYLSPASCCFPVLPTLSHLTLSHLPAHAHLVMCWHGHVLFAL